MPLVNLPPGCRSVRMEDGTRYVASREGGKVTVSDGHAAAIDRLDGNGTAGLVSASFREYGSGGNGRWCRNCQPARLWNAWNELCPRCGAATEPEQQGPEPSAAPAGPEVPASR